MGRTFFSQDSRKLFTHVVHRNGALFTILKKNFEWTFWSGVYFRCHYESILISQLADCVSPLLPIMWKSFHEKTHTLYPILSILYNSFSVFFSSLFIYLFIFFLPPSINSARYVHIFLRIRRTFERCWLLESTTEKQAIEKIFHQKEPNR